MIERVVRLGPGECSNIETGARFFATLALPGVDEAEARQDAAAAMVTSYLHAANRIDQTEAPFLDSRLNAFAQRSPEWAKPVFNAVKRRLRYRLLLARGLRPWILQGLGQAPKTVLTIKKFTQRQISLFLNGNDAQRADNFQKRVWRPSRPVLHLCAAWVTLAQEHFNLHGKPLDALEAMRKPEFLAQFLHRAELMEPLIESSRLSVSADDLIRFRLLPAAGVKNK